MTEKFDKAKEVISIAMRMGNGWSGIYNTRNWCGDQTIVLYDDLVTILYCDGNDYFEILGLSDDEFEELKIFYSDYVNKVGSLYESGEIYNH